MTIEETKALIQKDLMYYGVNDQKANFAMLAAEEIFLLYKKNGSFSSQDYNEWSFKIKRNPRYLKLICNIKGKSISPKSLQAKEDVHILDNILENTSMDMKYSYNKKQNRIELTVEKYPSLLENVRFAYQFLGKNKKDLWLGMAFNILAVAANVITPALTGKIIISYTSNIFYQTLITAGMLVAVNALYALTIGLANIFYNKTTYQMRGKLQTKLMFRLFNISDESLEKHGSGPFVKRINDDSMQISASITGILNIISNALYYLGVMVTSLLLDWVIFVAELITFLILFLLEFIRMYYFDIDKRKAIKAEDAHSGIVVDYIRGASEIKRFNDSGIATKKMSLAAQNAADLNENANTRTQKRVIINSIVTYAAFFLITVYLGYAIYSSRLEIPTALILFNYFTIVGMPLVMLIQRYMTFRKDFSISCERVEGLISGKEFSFDHHGDVSLHNAKGEICLKNVSFAYNHNNLYENDDMILKNINLSIKPNTMIGIVGESGSGKSTLLKLIAGQRQCALGNITIDGNDIYFLDKDSLCDNIAVINQSPYMFDATIRDNLLFAKSDATDDEIRNACEKACILDDIEKTEFGFDTVLGEKGVRFSIGQCQRLAIARGILKNSKIILFDESTSAADNLTQAKIKETIEKLRDDHTLVVITHRLSLIQNADNIIMLSNGKIIAQGSHDYLIKSSLDYKKLYLADETKI